MAEQVPGLEAAEKSFKAHKLIWIGAGVLVVGVLAIWLLRKRAQGAGMDTTPSSAAGPSELVSMGGVPTGMMAGPPANADPSYFFGGPTPPVGTPDPLNPDGSGGAPPGGGQNAPPVIPWRRDTQYDNDVGQGGGSNSTPSTGPAPASASTTPSDESSPPASTGYDSEGNPTGDPGGTSSNSSPTGDVAGDGGGGSSGDSGDS